MMPGGENSEGQKPPIQVQLKPGVSVDHPWVFWKQVEEPPSRIFPGAVVDIVDSRGQWTGRGFYNGHARVRLRVLTQRPEEVIDASWISKKIEMADRFRREDLKLEQTTNAYRIVHAEGDGLSGLVVDRFAQLVVVQLYSAGMYRFRPLIESILKNRYPDCEIYTFAERRVQKQESFDLRGGEFPKPQIVVENGIQFNVQTGESHKTGFFNDQRDNRFQFAQLCRGKSVLDLCCFSGAFSIYAKLGGSRESVGVELDPEAIRLANENARLNGVEIDFQQADMLAWLSQSPEKKFDVVLLDPAKQTRSREGIDQALGNYLMLNRAALKKVAPGGTFVTGSCSGWISEDQFLRVLRQAAWAEKRTLQIVRLSGAGADHPFLLNAAEGRYLKMVWARVL